MGYLAIAIVFSVLLWCDHKQYMAGHDAFFFEHKTDEEKRIRNAQIKILEKEAAR